MSSSREVLRDDTNESSAVYLLTSDDKHAVRGTDFPSNQLLYRKYLALFFFVEETFDHVPGNEKDQVSPICMTSFEARKNVMQIRRLHIESAAS